MVVPPKPPGKHQKDWKSERVKVTPGKFCGTPGPTRNAASVRSKPVLHPYDYWSMFITDDMLQEVLDETNAYKHRLLGSAASARPGYLPSRCSWPPMWCKRQKKDRTMDDLKKFLGTLYGLAAGDKGRCSVRKMCSDNPCTRVPWLAEFGVTESWMTLWFQNIHLQPEGWEKTAEAKRPARNAKLELP